MAEFVEFFDKVEQQALAAAQFPAVVQMKDKELFAGHYGYSTNFALELSVPGACRNRKAPDRGFKIWWT